MDHDQRFKELLREFGLPTLLVTHDYEDAASLADEVGARSTPAPVSELSSSPACSAVNEPSSIAPAT